MFPNINSPESIKSFCDDNLIPSAPSQNITKTVDVKELKPSPYYYSDILKKKNLVVNQRTNERNNKNKQQSCYGKSSSLDSRVIEWDQQFLKRYTLNEDGARVRISQCNSSDSLTSEDSDCSECRKRRNWHADALASVQASCNILLNENNASESKLINPEFINSNDALFTPQAIFCLDTTELQDCNNSVLDEKLSFLISSEEMSSNIRQVYETAFDSMVKVSTDDQENVQNVTKNPILYPFPSDLLMRMPNETEEILGIKSVESKKVKNSKNLAKQDAKVLQEVITDLRIMKIDDQDANALSSSQLSACTFITPSPPSTAPLPIKFPMKHEQYFMNSIKSVPNLKSKGLHPRIRNIKSTASDAIKKISPRHSNNSITVTEYNDSSKAERPQSAAELGIPKQKFINFSSNESMRSSNNSIDSLRSSTSEGNRSTTSSESRRSSSISSHDSDSGANILYPLRNQSTINSKLHVLSPISDKSVQEQGLEIVETSQNCDKTNIVNDNVSLIEDQQLMKEQKPSNKTLSLLSSE